MATGFTGDQLVTVPRKYVRLILRPEQAIVSLNRICIRLAKEVTRPATLEFFVPSWNTPVRYQKKKIPTVVSTLKADDEPRFLEPGLIYGIGQAIFLRVEAPETGISILIATNPLASQTFRQVQKQEQFLMRFDRASKRLPLPRQKTKANQKFVGGGLKRSSTKS